MAVQSQSFSTIVQNGVAAVQGAARQLLDFTVGSVLRAVVEATAAMALWLQGIALEIASLTRFSTSNGPDADSWAADFDFTRLAAQAAQGPVTFSRFTPTNQATIPAATSNGTDANGNIVWIGGYTVQTADGSQKYQVIPDATQATYNATQNAYLIAAGASTGSATVQAIVQSSAGNVGAGFINTLGGALSGIDAVTNPSPFQNGADAETDAAMRARFVLYIAGLSKATLAAIGSAISNIQQGVVYTITENQNFDGTANPGYFFVVVDDGSGNPSISFLSTVANAVNAVRAIGANFGVFGPTVVSATITLTITVATGFDKPTLSAQVQTALLKYISGLSIGQALPYTRLAQIAYDVSSGITNVSLLQLNAGTADLVATSKQAIRSSSIVVS
ncbi:MAG: putative phage baseplate protein [Gammaproteobacteria bacterium]|nr:putative phage baseplate protein [Gammaproteobacteria bacterium]